MCVLAYCLTLYTLFTSKIVIYFVLHYIAHMLLVNVNQKTLHKENFACRFPHTQQPVPRKREQVAIKQVYSIKIYLIMLCGNNLKTLKETSWQYRNFAQKNA